MLAQLAGYYSTRAVTRAEVLADQFGDGEPGAVFDVSDLSTLSQDAAGNTPVTAADQPVGRMLDVSGNGNHATAASDAKRLMLRTNGVIWWLESDGVAGVLLFDINVPSGALLVCFGIGFADAAGVFAYELAAASRGDSSQYVSRDPGLNEFDFNFRNAGFSTTGGLRQRIPYTIGQIYVATSTADGSALRHRRDGARIASSNVGTWPSNPPITRGAIGANTDSGQHKATLFTGAVIRAAAPSGADLAQVEKWLASKSGVAF